MTSDRELFELLYRDTRADVLAYLVRRCSSAEDAADALSETYLILWRKLRVVPPGDQARLWLFGVARNVVRRGVDRERSRDELAQRLAAELRRLEPERPDHDQRATRALTAALASLRPRDREIVTLTAWEGLTPREIATVMGMRTNVVRTRLHRARARLRTRLGQAEITAARERAVMPAHHLRP